MSKSNTTSAPQTPAASLLFQAPTFQEPMFHEPVEQKPLKRERSEEPAQGASQKQSTKRVSGRSKKKAAQASAPELALAAENEVEPTPESGETQPAGTTKRRRSRKRASDEEQNSSTTDSAVSSDAIGVSEDTVTEQLAGSETGEDTNQAGTSTVRRRRRRTHSATTETPSDQVQALSGSTRLEAKKQRRREGRKEGRRRHSISESEFLARRESVNRQMIIREKNGLNQIAVIEDDLLVEHYVARHTNQTMVGNIFLGRVQNVLPSMEAAFIDIGRGRNAVLYAGEVNWDAVGLEGHPRRIEAALQPGDAVMVQVTKDPIGHKGARLTNQVTLAGRYLVFIPGGAMMGISRKLPDSERARLKKILKKVVPAGAGVIVRTAAEGASEQQLSDDVSRLTRQWDDIVKKRENKKAAPTVLRSEPELAVRVVRDIFNEDFDRLLIQGHDTYQTVKTYVQELSPELSDRVEKFVGTDDVFHQYRVDEQLAKGFDRKVWLPSGGTLIIDRTEAMTVIDVNTGKFIGAGGTLEETVTRNNLEAAEEIVRQLRLRDIGGIVIIDFVDMVLESNRDLVLRRLVECLGRDRTRHQVTEITSLGLVQLTRKRVGEGLVEAFSTPCETCQGRGFIVHQEPVESGNQPQVKHSHRHDEPRRLEEGPDHERARLALSAIAAASTHTPNAEGNDGAEKVDHDQEVSVLAVAEREQAEPLAQDNPAPTSNDKLAPLSDDKAQPRRRKATLRDKKSGVRSESDQPKKTSRRRRAVSAAVVDPAHTQAAPSVVTTSGTAAPVTSLDQIKLPEAHQTHVASRRRRVVSSGVVDTGAEKR